MGSRWRTDFEAVEAAAARMDSGRPVPMTMRSKVVGSIGGYGGRSLFMVGKWRKQS